MNILTKMIVSNSDITKNYKICRDRAENCGKIFILKNNVPDAVLFSITAYEKLSALIEYAEHLDDADIARILDFSAKNCREKNNQPIND